MSTVFCNPWQLLGNLECLGIILYALILAHFHQIHHSGQSEIITTRCVILGFINDQLLLHCELCEVLQGHQNLLVIKMDIVALKRRMNRYRSNPKLDGSATG